MFQISWLKRALLALPVALVACGGGGGGDPVGPAGSCSVADQNVWLGDYMNEWYFWYRISPRPDPSPYPSVDSYFAALLFTGSSGGSTFGFPADRYSRIESSASFDRFFSDGAMLGYGISVAGLELARDATRPLYVRYVEALSPAALQGVQRGDQIISANGRAAASIVAADDYSALSAAATGETLTLVLRRGGVDRTRVLSSAVFNLSPVQGATVQTSAAGRKLGYVQVKDMISQALVPMDAAFAQFKAAGVQDLVLDLRYNGGGLVSTGATLASYIAGTRGSGLNYATLLYNDKRAGTNNVSFPFASLAASLGVARVFVLTGQRTCSASEQVVNGLRGAGLDVVTVGDTTCGKPVGFLPTTVCSRTYSVVNFESVNQRNEGRYFDGLQATCAVSEDFTAAQGGSDDPLAVEARRYVDAGKCSPRLLGRAQPLSLRADGARLPDTEPGEHRDMMPR